MRQVLFMAFLLLLPLGLSAAEREHGGGGARISGGVRGGGGWGGGERFEGSRFRTGDRGFNAWFGVGPVYPYGYSYYDVPTYTYYGEPGFYYCDPNTEDCYYGDTGFGVSVY